VLAMEVELDAATESPCKLRHDSIDRGILRTLYGVPPNLTRLRGRRRPCCPATLKRSSVCLLNQTLAAA